MQAAWNRLLSMHMSACMQPALRSKCGHLHLVTQCKSRGRRPASRRQRPAIRGDALHACCMQPACSLHHAEKYALNEHVHSRRIFQYVFFL